MDPPEEPAPTTRNQPSKPIEPIDPTEATGQRAPLLRGDHPGGQALPGTKRWSSIAAPLISLVVVGAMVLGIFTIVHGAPLTSHSASATNGAASASHASDSLPQAPDFTLTTFNGGSYHLASQRGHVVVLYFMSTTCVTCERGSYFVASAMQEVNNPNVQALAIDMNPGDTANDVTAFEQSASIPANAPLTWAFDMNQRVATHYGVLELGTVFVVDTQGRIVYESDGSVVIGQLVQVIQRYA